MGARDTPFHFSNFKKWQQGKPWPLRFNSLVRFSVRNCPPAHWTIYWTIVHFPMFGTSLPDLGWFFSYFGTCVAKFGWKQPTGQCGLDIVWTISSTGLHVALLVMALTAEIGKTMHGPVVGMHGHCWVQLLFSFTTVLARLQLLALGLARFWHTW